MRMRFNDHRDQPVIFWWHLWRIGSFSNIIQLCIILGEIRKIFLINIHAMNIFRHSIYGQKLNQINVTYPCKRYKWVRNCTQQGNFLLLGVLCLNDTCCKYFSCCCHSLIHKCIDCDCFNLANSTRGCTMGHYAAWLPSGNGCCIPIEKDAQKHNTTIFVNSKYWKHSFFHFYTWDDIVCNSAHHSKVLNFWKQTHPKKTGHWIYANLR